MVAMSVVGVSICFFYSLSCVHVVDREAGCEGLKFPFYKHTRSQNLQMGVPLSLIAKRTTPLKRSFYNYRGNELPTEQLIKGSILHGGCKL